VRKFRRFFFLLRLGPRALIRRQAMFSGVLGDSSFWRVVGYYFIGSDMFKKYLGRNVEVIDVSALGPGRVMQIITAQPVTRRRRRKLRKRGMEPLTLKQQTAYSRRWATETVAAKRAAG